MTRVVSMSARDRALDACSVHADHANFVWRSLQRLGVREPDLDDVHQEVFLVVHRKLGTFDGTSELTTWLFGICIRVAAAYRRRAYMRREAPMANVPAERTSPNFGPEESTAAAEAREAVGRILDGMDLQKRAVFVMFEIEGMGCTSIAEIMGVPVGTVYSRLSAARQAFKKGVRRLQVHSTRGGVA